MAKPLPSLPLTGASVRSRLPAINALLLQAQGVVSAIAWHAVDVQNRDINELALISKAARYHQDVGTLAANIPADLHAAIGPRSGSALTSTCPRR